MAARRKPAVVHVVQRLNVCNRQGLLLRLPGSTRLQSFPDVQAAELDRAERERKARSVVNPFTYGGNALHYQTSFDEGRLCDWLLDEGLEPPKPGKSGRDWQKWWQETHQSMTPLQIDKVWEALDKARFFEVVQRPAKPVVYLVVRINWRYNDNFWEAEEEGGVTYDKYCAYRSREKAEWDCDESNGIARDAWGENVDPDEGMFDSIDRHRRQEGGLAPPVDWPAHRESLRKLDEANFYEVIEVEVDDL
jgi:hypothetical protein